MDPILLQQIAAVLSAIFGLTSTYMLTKGDGRGWAVGALMAVFMGYVYFQVSLFGSFAIQIVFFLIQLTGLWRWKTGKNKDMRALSQRMSAKEAVATAIFWLACMGVGGFTIAQFEGRLPYLDAFAVTGNILAQVTMMRGRPECWIIYMTINACYIVLNYMTGIYIYVALYSIYMSVALKGWREWNKKRDEVSDCL